MAEVSDIDSFLRSYDLEKHADVFHSDALGFTSIDDLVELTDGEVDEILQTIKMPLGEKKRLKRALRDLASGSTGGAHTGGTSGGAPATALRVSRGLLVKPEHLTLEPEPLGRGAFATVFAGRFAFDGSGTERAVAFKQLRAELFVDAKDVATIEREVETMAMVSAHPNIVKLYGVLDDPRGLHGAGILMELSDRGSLYDVCVERPACPLSPPHASRAFIPSVRRHQVHAHRQRRSHCAGRRARCAHVRIDCA